MTERLKGVYVAFDRDIRDDDAEFILNAIRMIKGVKSVEANVVDADDWMNRQNIKSEYRTKILNVLKELDKN